jgi:aconitate hydratase
MDTYAVRSALKVGGERFFIRSIPALERAGFTVDRLPYTVRVLLENLLRHEDGVVVTADDIATLARWSPTGNTGREIAFHPARVLLQDFTGVPALVDLAAMRDAVRRLGRDPVRVDARVPVELVIDHSISVDAWGSSAAFAHNEALDYARNRERYAFLRWGQAAFDGLEVVPPNQGIVHQINLERLARVVFAAEGEAWLDTLVGTDSHTPMVNGLGVLGWGVGGIEAEAAMLGQPLSLRCPRVVGLRLDGALAEGVTATDLVLHVTELLRAHGVVGSFIELFGEGVRRLSLADRATIGNMAPEYGATCAIVAPDAMTLDYLRLTGRPPEQVALVEAYLKEQGLFVTPESPEPLFSEVIHLDLSTVNTSLAGPRRPQERVPLADAGASFQAALPELVPDASARPQGGLGHGAVVIAAITSCTNTSNPSVMLAAGLLARNAAERGLRARPWVKTSLAPGSRVVTEYYTRSGLMTHLERLGFSVVGYGCTTCIGNSGPLSPEVSAAIRDDGLVAVAVLSGNRNFEGRIHPEVRAAYLASPPLVIAYALAGRIDHDFAREPLGRAPDGAPVFLRDIWPSNREIQATVAGCLVEELYRRQPRQALLEPRWLGLAAVGRDCFEWDAASTYVRPPPWFEGISLDLPPLPVDVVGARALLLLGDGVTTDHISPAGPIAPASPAGAWLRAAGVASADLHSYGARRGNHEVMVRGTFASGRLRNRLAGGREGGWTRHAPSGEEGTVFEVAARYRAEATPLVILAGRDYGSGSSRDWAAKGTALLGVRAVLAESFERIHRANLVGMGVLPLQLPAGSAEAVAALDGTERFDVEGVAAAVSAPGGEVTVRVRAANGEQVLRALVRIDTPREVLYFRHGGLLPYVLRERLGAEARETSTVTTVPAEAAAPSAPSVEEGSKESFPASDPPSYG